MIRRSRRKHAAQGAFRFGPCCLPSGAELSPRAILALSVRGSVSAHASSLIRRRRAHLRMDMSSRGSSRIDREACLTCQALPAPYRQGWTCKVVPGRRLNATIPDISPESGENSERTLKTGSSHNARPGARTTEESRLNSSSRFVVVLGRT